MKSHQFQFPAVQVLLSFLVGFLGPRLLTWQPQKSRIMGYQCRASRQAWNVFGPVTRCTFLDCTFLDCTLLRGFLPVDHQVI